MDIAAMSMSLSAARLAESYSIKLAKQTMDMERLAAQEMLEMLPDAQFFAKGEFLDFYV